MTSQAAAAGTPSPSQPKGRSYGDFGGHHGTEYNDSRSLVGRPLRYGVVIFDNGQPGGPGWSCIAGETPERIDSQVGLPTDVLWWSNAEYRDFRAGGLSQNGWFRHAGFTRIQMRQALSEWGAQKDPPDAVAAMLATLFGRIMGCARLALEAASDSGRNLGRNEGAASRLAGGDCFRAPALAGDLSRLFPTPDQPRGDIELAVQQSVQVYTKTQVRGVRDGVLIPLRRPRVPYALTMVTCAVPEGSWQFVGPERMPQSGRHAWLSGQGRPYFARVHVSGGEDDALALFAFGSGAQDRGGGSVRRGWASGLEVDELARYASVEIDGAWLGETFAPLPTSLPTDLAARLVSPLALSSWSAGVFAENWWLGALQPVRNRQQKDGNCPSFRAAWLRAHDRVEMFRSVLPLHRLGYAVTGYGVGTATVSSAADEVRQLAADAYEAGLMVPLSIDEARSDVWQQLGPGTWGGIAESQLEAGLRAAGRRDILWRLDGLVHMPERDARREIANIMNDVAGARPLSRATAETIVGAAAHDGIETEEGR